jgi:hypothetical protein
MDKAKSRSAITSKTDINELAQSIVARLGCLLNKDAPQT